MLCYFVYEIFSKYMMEKAIKGTSLTESEAAILNKWFYENFLVFNKSKFITLKANRPNLEEFKIQMVLL